MRNANAAAKLQSAAITNISVDDPPEVHVVAAEGRNSELQLLTDVQEGLFREGVRFSWRPLLWKQLRRFRHGSPRDIQERTPHCQVQEEFQELPSPRPRSEARPGTKLTQS